MRNHFRRRNPVEARHLHIQNHEIRFLFAHEIQRFHAVASDSDDFVTGLFEHFFQIHADERFVIRHHNAIRFHLFSPFSYSDASISESGQRIRATTRSSSFPN